MEAYDAGRWYEAAAMAYSASIALTMKAVGGYSGVTIGPDTTIADLAKITKVPK